MSDKTPTSLRNQFLIAMPNMADPNFADSVTYICEHNENGAMGIVINRPTDMTLGEVFAQIGIDSDEAIAHQQEIVCAGGPVQLERGFVLHDSRDNWESTLNIAPGINLTTSRDILQALAEDRGPQQIIIALGYAGWGAGQLEDELKENAWLTCEASPEILFETPIHLRRQAAAASIGVDLQLLSPDTGHA
ncbi:YqgE/AlgH family protein [Aestuariirhabdus sp. Z084]|uniref:YqgE/AlgH family protein n=1 Tax=Aestuariirhabdus haliotis TaxID=2918751 RepID=UPI00201B41FA|nr:YqgE/AlgH family protein [Aestuariirhabdus haliotis]MCL6414141.1 YqgE/AlgH family protein [Aestuariirhabdus haliotis]MCL6418073.1 YqgE/AlgH family protein [Aestuariirhabdus haliotis]